MTASKERVLGAVLVAWALCGCPGSQTTPDAGTPDAGEQDAGYSWRWGDPLPVDVSATFAPGTVLRDRYGGGTATVDASGKISLVPDPSGVVLLEEEGAQPTPFTWSNATVYFVMTDRFFNGDPTNDESYGRAKDNEQEVGTWHGGDFDGLGAKLDHIESLGATAIWITPPVEQVHGWASGGTGDFKHYAYHGYWALDFTRLDANLGTTEDLRAFVDAAHARGIRVLFDVVMNHPGYATGDDLVQYLPEVIDEQGFLNWVPSGNNKYAGWHNFVNYNSISWRDWWSPAWIRAGFPLFDPGGQDPLTQQLAFLPDFKTESTQVAGIPTLLVRKTDTAAVEVPGYTVRQYLVKWHTDWVRDYGIDGFRADTARHVELASWRLLKDEGVLALRAWKAANPAKKIDDSDFWMTGEAFGHGVTKDAYYTDGGFDSMINFSFQNSIQNVVTTHVTLGRGADALEAIYAQYSGATASDPSFGILSYISSHDTKLFLGDVALNDVGLQRQAATALMLVPGGAQIFYGDETGRLLGPALSDRAQGTRSDMNWDTIDTALLAHWQKLGDFRKRHAAVGGGVHQRLESPPGTYAFSREYDREGVTDSVVAVVTPPAP